MGDNRKRYEITCPHCGKIQYACKSIFHEMGAYDAGRGRCLGCGEPMRLQYDPKTDTMEAIRWETIRRQQDRKGEENGAIDNKKR